MSAVAPPAALPPAADVGPRPLTLPYRLRLGVTGHRELADPQQVEAAVHRLLDRLDQVLGADRAVRLEWSLVAPLAKGADRLVARAVLEHAPAERRPELEAIVPLPLAEYRSDFDTPADRREFEALLARCASVTELNAGMFLTTLGLAVLHLLGVGHGDTAEPLLKGATFLSIVLPPWATAIHAMGRQLELERLGSRSKHMARVLERLALSAKEARTTDELRAVVREATHVVGLENHEWSVLLSFAPPELPA